MRVESRLCLSWFKQYFGSMPGNSISPNYSKPARCLFYTISGVLESAARPAALPTAQAKCSFPISVHPALWRDLPEEWGHTWGLGVCRMAPAQDAQITHLPTITESKYPPSLSPCLLKSSPQENPSSKAQGMNICAKTAQAMLGKIS